MLFAKGLLSVSAYRVARTQTMTLRETTLHGLLFFCRAKENDLETKSGILVPEVLEALTDKALNFKFAMDYRIALGTEGR